MDGASGEFVEDDGVLARAIKVAIDYVQSFAAPLQEKSGGCALLAPLAISPAFTRKPRPKGRGTSLDLGHKNLFDLHTRRKVIKLSLLEFSQPVRLGTDEVTVLDTFAPMLLHPAIKL